MGIRLNYTKLMLLAVVVTAIFAAMEQFMQAGAGGSLVLTMVIWLAIAEGCVALMAAAEVCHASWHRPIMRQMLSAYPMIPVIGFIFVLLALTQSEIYPWINEEGIWINRVWANKNVFIARHLLMLGAVFLVARRFTVDTMRGRDSGRFWAVIYLVLFMFDQTMVGLEWVMSLEKPWFSTLFGAFFGVSAFQSGIVTAAVVLFVWRSRFDDGLRYAQKSIGGLMFGFATFWAYFYFSQLIVIWYGNLPEEVSYLARRIGYHTPYWWFARMIFGLCWVIPFSVLLGRKPKTTPAITYGIGLTILTGFVCEKWLMIHPAVPVNPLIAVIEMALLAFVFASVMKSGDDLLPAAGVASVEPGAAAAPAAQH